MEQILECVANFSEGNDLKIIEQLKKEIDTEPNVRVLHTDIGASANRTVITFAGKPVNVVNAAFKGIKKSTELIDMQKHTGTHPRIGATDVCPLIPINGISMKETVEMSISLAEKVGNELKIPVYLYEASARKNDRKRLEQIRKGGYEHLKTRIGIDYWSPDYGDLNNYKKSGATVIGARNYLIAYNINLKTNELKVAKEIAGKIRESGIRRHDKLTPGMFKNLKAIGWEYPEYGIVQVSTNITNISTTPVYEVYEAVKNLAANYDTQVWGSELIGLIPELPLLDAGRYYSGNNEKNANKLINKAINSLGLTTLKPFKPGERIIEWML